MKPNLSYKNIVLIVSLSSALVSCASTDTIYYKDGRVVHAASCSGSSWLPCYEDAGNACRENGYEVLEKNDNKEFSFFKSGDKKEIIFVCRASQN